MTTFTMQDLTTETPEEKEAMDVIQGATGAQYRFVDVMADQKKPSVEVIINNICRELQALSTVISSYQANAEVIKKLLDAAALSAKQPTYPKEQEDACGKCTKNKS